MLKHYGRSVEDIAERFQPLCYHEAALDALEVLRRDFGAHDAVGPVRTATFLTGGRDDDIQADVVGYVGALLHAVKLPRAIAT